MDYAKGLDEDKSKDSAKNLIYQRGTDQDLQKDLRAIPPIRKNRFLFVQDSFIFMARILVIVRRPKSPHRDERVFPRSPYIKVAEILLMTCMPSVIRGGKK